MPPDLYDAHLHLADPALNPYRDQIEAGYQSIGLKQAVVVGTSPEDWPRVLEFCNNDPRLIPAVGLHPWRVNATPENWQQPFLQALDSGAQAIGEIGLDKWIEGYDIEQQQAAFQWQLAQATQRNLPVSIHCLQAIGPLMDTLRSVALPTRGIHLHAYNGPIELIPELVALGAYFSFNAGQLKPNKTRVPERIRAVPANRLLIETDAPDMLPPAELRSFELPSSETGKPPTHPATLVDGYTVIAKARGTSLEKLAALVAKNFATYFLK